MSAVRTYVLLALGLALAVVVFLMVTAPVRELPPDLMTPMTASPPVTVSCASPAAHDVMFVPLCELHIAGCPTDGVRYEMTVWGFMGGKWNGGQEEEVPRG